ncbi:MAG TPA: hypothetical protein VFO46_11005, partial [Candidatus Sulfotelmatobacter sp.]|nr:hypothetical protein [Candidatus Sulfotelmatobacter sp.]
VIRKCVVPRTTRSKLHRSGQQGLDAKKNKTSLPRVKCFYLTSPFIEPGPIELAIGTDEPFSECDSSIILSE